MESPFYTSNQTSNTVILYLEPILNTYYKTYTNILTVSHMPPGPLNGLIFPIRPEKLSPFQSPGITGAFPQCTYAVGKYRIRPVMSNIDTFMTAEDIPAVFAYLEANGYLIDRSLTHMIFDSKVDLGGTSTNRYSGNRKMICMFSYVGGM